MRIAICWTEIAGYTAACWRALAGRAGVDLRVLAWPSNFSRTGSQYQRSLVEGLPVRLLEEHEQQDSELVAKHVNEHRPDLVIMGGWAERPYRQLVWDDRLKDARMVLAMDTPWRGTWRQRLARWKIGNYIDRLDAIFVPGVRGQEFALRLKMPAQRIFTGMLGFDFALYQHVWEKRASGPWPKTFVFLGRYSIEKALDSLAAGYAHYRGNTKDSWPLHCYGSGPLRNQLEGHEGIEVHEWVQPADQPDLLAKHGAGILTSRREAWSLAVAEQMASGLPMICTDAVGAAPDLIVPEQTGLVCPTDSPREIGNAMRWMTDHHDRLAEMGQAARERARPYGAQQWCERVVTMGEQLLAMPRRRR